MKSIVCINNNWGIGKDNKLLFHIKEDMNFFKEKTMDKVIIYGNNTLKSFPHKAPLKGRINIVITRDINNIDEESVFKSSFCRAVEVKTKNENFKDLFKYNLFSQYCNNKHKILNVKPILLVANSIEQAVDFSRKIAYEDDIFVCGGSSIYNQMMTYIDEIFVTKVNSDKEADSYFLNLDKDFDKNNSPKWIVRNIDVVKTEDDRDIICEFWHYIRKDKYLKNKNIVW